ncbi:MAG: flagellar filament capping protein FliD [Halopseudomonas sp.]|jgi:flagellar hook-associated protein 2|uniref:flagellar filament capping protein FliD n=1 Tax=Halopseudomonas sp. TaxID=2901191 RepID=UPI003002E26A
MALGGIGAGIGSGLDIRSIVDALVNAEKAPKEAQLNRLEKATTTKVSALGQFRSAMSAFQTSLADLNSASLFQKRSAVSANTDIFTATAGSKATAGNYDVKVFDIAKSSKIALAGVDSPDTVIGTGTLDIQIGSEPPLQVQIGEGQDTLTGIRDAINLAGKDSGLTATIVNDPNGTGGARIVLSSATTGAGNDITVSSTAGATGDLSILNFPGSNGMVTPERAPQVITQAQNASFSVDGITLSSATNTIDNAIEGVTLTLNAAQSAEDQAANKTVGLAVSEDREAVKTSITAFVDAYNKLVGTVGSLTKVTAVGGDDSAPVTGALVGDSSVRSFMNGIRSDLTSQSGGELRILADLGITTERDGKLKIDDAKLDTVIESGVDKLGDFLTGDTGLMARLENRVKPYTETGGLLDGRTKALQNTISDVSDQREALGRRTAQLESRLLAQFNAMDSLVGQLSGTSNYLSGVLESLPGVVKQDR